MDQLAELEKELTKYKERLVHMSSEFAATKAGSAYGVEYYDIQCRVLQTMVVDIQNEIANLKRQKKLL